MEAKRDCAKCGCRFPMHKFLIWREEGGPYQHGEICLDCRPEDKERFQRRSEALIRIWKGAPA